MRPLGWRVAGLAGCLLLVLALGPGATSAQEPEPGPEPASTGPVELALLGQTAVVTPPGRVDLRLVTEGAPDDGFIELVLHGQVRTRTEFVRAVEGQGLRTRVHSGTRPRLDTLPVDPADGARVVSLSLDPDEPGGIGLTNPGAYPLRVRLVTAADDLLGELLTFVVVAPEADTSAPPFAVAVVAELGAPPATRPDGSVVLDPAAVEHLTALAGAIGATDAPATLSIVPETLEALTLAAMLAEEAAEDDAETEPGTDDDPPPHEAAAAMARPALDALQTAAAGRTVLARPFADVSVEALVAAGLAEELDHHQFWGTSVLRERLGASPVTSVALADADLGRVGAAALAAQGVTHLVLDTDGLAVAPTGGLSLAHRFPVPIDGRGRQTVQAVEADDELGERLAAEGDAVLVAQHLVAELAVIRGEQPAIPRGVAIRVGAQARPDVVAVTMAALDAAGTLLEPVDLEDLFDRIQVLTDPAGAEVPRTLDVGDPPSIGQDIVARLPAARRLQSGYASLVGSGDPRNARLGTALLLATARDLPLADRRAQLDVVASEVAALVTSVDLPAGPQVTLTAREGTIPLTVSNSGDHPVEVMVRLDSRRLEFPGGEERALTLPPGTTRSDLDVRTRSTGAFPLDVTLYSPDGTIELASTRYTVRSTAVSGVGLILSVGAGLFLAAWWGSHWRRTRRSRRLVPLAPHGDDPRDASAR